MRRQSRHVATHWILQSKSTDSEEEANRDKPRQICLMMQWAEASAGMAAHYNQGIRKVRYLPHNVSQLDLLFHIGECLKITLITKILLPVATFL